MKKLNTTLDREPMTSQEIRDRQDFNYILKGAAAAKVPIWKSIWFYGPVGLAMVTLVVSAARMNPKNEQFDKNITLSQFIQPLNADFSKVEMMETKSGVLTETKSNSKKENESPVTAKVEPVSPSKTTTPKTEAVPSTMEQASVVMEKEVEPIVKTKAPVVETKVAAKPSRTMPNIAGVFNGRIPIAQLCANGQIDCNNGFEVIAFDIQYDDGSGMTVRRIEGNKIPTSICSLLQRYNVGSPVFISRIIAANQVGEIQQLLSMSLEPTF